MDLLGLPGLGMSEGTNLLAALLPFLAAMYLISVIVLSFTFSIIHHPESPAQMSGYKNWLNKFQKLCPLAFGITTFQRSFQTVMYIASMIQKLLNDRPPFKNCLL